jgi:Beta-propeller repeat
MKIVTTKLLVLIACVLLTACGAGNSSTSTATTSTMGGTITGLTSGALVLQNNSTDALTIVANANSSTFVFATPMVIGATYSVTVGTQPTGFICSVTNGTGTVVSSIVTSVVVTCVANWIGTKQLGVATKVTQGKSVATDASGNVYVAGLTNAGLDGNTLTGFIDFFVTKYNSSGVKQYTKQLGVAVASTQGLSVATDVSGNVYVAGFTTGGLDGNTLTGTNDFFVTKYDSSGVKQYTRQLGVAGVITQGASVATDASGNVYVAGSTAGGLDGNTNIGLNGFNNYFVTKYDSSGVKQFTKLEGVVSTSNRAFSVTTDVSGNVYVVGETRAGLDGNTLTGFTDFFVTKYNSSGVKQYTKQLGVAGKFTVANAVKTDISGNVYVAGNTTGGLDGNTLTGTQDFFVTKYDSNGVKLYTKQLGVATKSTTGSSVTTDASGNVYVAGSTAGGLDGNTLIGTGDFFVTKYDSSGVKLYTKQLGVATKSTTGSSVATDANGNVYVAGSTAGGLDGNTLIGTGDFFVTKYDSSGVKQ